MSNGNSSDFNDFRLISHTNEPDETPPPPFEADPAKLIYITRLPARPAIRSSCSSPSRSTGTSCLNEGEADMQDARDFDQLKRTHELTLADIETLATTAAALEIDVKPFYNRRDTAVPGLARLEGRLAEGGTHAVDSDDAAAIESVFTETMSIKGDLQTLISHHRHYQDMLANHQRHVDALPGRARSFRYADGVEPTRIAEGYITYAANPEPVLAESKAAFDEIFAAIRRGDILAAHQAANKARVFSTREHFLSALVRKGTLVASV